MRKPFVWLCCMLLLLCPFSSCAEDDVPAVPVESRISRLLEQTLSEDAVARPQTLRCDPEMLHFAAEEAYLDSGVPGSGPMLYIVFRVYSKVPGSLPVFLEQEQPDQIEYNGKTVSLDRVRGSKSLISFDIMSGGDSWSWYEYSDEGLFVFVCIMNPDPEQLKTDSIRTFSCRCENMQTGKTENGTVEVGIPAMLIQE